MVSRETALLSLDVARQKRPCMSECSRLPCVGDVRALASGRRSLQGSDQPFVRTGVRRRGQLDPRPARMAHNPPVWVRLAQPPLPGVVMAWSPCWGRNRAVNPRPPARSHALARAVCAPNRSGRRNGRRRLLLLVPLLLPLLPLLLLVLPPRSPSLTLAPPSLLERGRSPIFSSSAPPSYSSDP